MDVIKQRVAKTGPFTLTIFGITGDLANRMLLPALYDLAVQDLLPKPFRILGVSRRPHTTDEVVSTLEKSVKNKGDKVNPDALKLLRECIEIVKMDPADQDGYPELRRRIDEVEKESGVCMNRLFYLAIPSRMFATVSELLGKNGLNESCPHGTGQSRLLIEKPLGHDLASAQELSDKLAQHFSEDQIYRIDHFLAKETAQNILAFRAHNPLFNSVWDKNHISHILISAAEDIDIEGRTVFYEQTGALRDMIQSHLLQLTALTTMELPAALDATQLHVKKQELLDSIAPVDPARAVRGQYKGYREEVSNPDSLIETYAALDLRIQNERWQDVPILLRTGKAMQEKVTEITLVFAQGERSNVLNIQLAPFEGISVKLYAKKPGFEKEMQEVTMDFCYSRSFAGHRQPTPYERVLIDAFKGDQALFATNDEVLSSWRILEPVLQEWDKSDTKMHEYERGSWGPTATDDLAADSGTSWPTEVIKTCAVHFDNTGSQ